jgi:hypothetical protein
MLLVTVAPLSGKPCEAVFLLILSVMAFVF